jgi:hypothetical protein
MVEEARSEGIFGKEEAANLTEVPNIVIGETYGARATRE